MTIREPQNEEPKEPATSISAGNPPGESDFDESGNPDIDYEAAGNDDGGYGPNSYFSHSMSKDD